MPLRCRLALENLKRKALSTDAENQRKLLLQGVLRHKNLRPGATYWSIFSTKPITITSVDTSGPTPIVHYSWESNKTNVVQASSELNATNDFFVSTRTKNGQTLLGKVTLSTLVSRPDNIPRIMALEGISKLLTVGSSGSAGGPLAKRRNTVDPGSLRKQLLLASASLKAGRLQEVDAFLEKFHDETGVNPYLVGAFQSLTLTANYTGNGSGGYASSSVTYFKLLDDEWRDIIGMPYGNINPGLDAAMAHYTWMSAKEKFKSLPEPNQGFDDFIDKIQEKYPDKNIVYVLSPTNSDSFNNHIQSQPLRPGNIFLRKDTVQFSKDSTGVEKESPNITAIDSYRNVGSNLTLRGLEKVHENIVVVIHDGTSHSTNIDNAKIDLLFRGGASAVFDYAPAP